MRRILAIFRKDARRLWPQAAALVLMMTFAALLDPAYRKGTVTYYDVLCSFALPLTCCLIVISVIHQEKLPGDRQYWLTRPYSRRELAAAKILFVAAFVNLPVLAYHVIVYAAMGIPLGDHVAALFWRQIFFTVFYILPAAALAVLTRTLGNALAISLVGCITLWAANMAFLFFTRRPLLLATVQDTATTIGRAALLAAGVSAILAIQYVRRSTGTAAALAVVVAVAFFSRVPPSPRAVRPPSAAPKATAHLSLDPDPNRRSSMSPAGDPDLLTFDIPVRIDGAPDGIAIDRAYVPINAYRSGRDFVFNTLGNLHDVGGGRAWLSFSVTSQQIERTQKQPVDLSGAFRVQLFGEPSVMPLPRGSTVVAPRIGACRDTSESEGGISFTCYSPSPRAVVVAGIPGSRANWIVSAGSVEGPVPTASGFQPLKKHVSLLSYRDWAQVDGLKLITARPLPPVQVSCRLPAMSLQKYLVTGGK